MSDFQFFLPTRILFGVGCLEELATTPHLPKGGKAMIVMTSGGSMLRHGHLARVQGCLSNQGVRSVIYDKITPNPESAQIDEAAATARRLEVDFVVGLGGGSAIDAAKAIALTAANGGSIWDYLRGGTGGGKTPEQAPLPVVAIPSTAGTGSEADHLFVVSKSGGDEKIGIGLEGTFPHLAVVDPALTRSMPPRATAFTGLDAFFHAAESYLSLRRNPIGNMLALEAVHLVTHTLPDAVNEPGDQAARTVLAWAACAGGICLTTCGSTAQHALEHALSGRNPALPHGLGLACLSRAYFRHMAAVVPDRITDLALAMGVEEVEDLPEADRPAAFLAALDELLGRVGVGHDRLRDWGFGPDDAEALADIALATGARHFEATPGPMTRDDVVAILREALA
ncbi:MAG: iron-containing alcohol dehydrogenase [Desulfovibrionaceae bacterium]